MICKVIKLIFFLLFLSKLLWKAIFLFSYVLSSFVFYFFNILDCISSSAFSIHATNLVAPNGKLTTNIKKKNKCSYPTRFPPPSPPPKSLKIYFKARFFEKKKKKHYLIIKRSSIRFVFSYASLRFQKNKNGDRFIFYFFSNVMVNAFGKNFKFWK